MTPNEMQAAMDRLMEYRAGCIVSTTDPSVMEICNYDLSVAEEQLQRWMSRHADDCDQISANPLRLKVYLTIRPDAESKVLFQKKKERKTFSEKKRQEMRQWDSMFSEGNQ